MKPCDTHTTTPPALTARPPTPAGQTRPFTVQWYLFRRSRGGGLPPFTSDAVVISLPRDAPPPAARLLKPHGLAAWRRLSIFQGNVEQPLRIELVLMFDISIVN